MNELKKRLTRELQQDLQVEINKTLIWNLPIQALKVDYTTVQQTKMDVLMKMLLNTFNQAGFESVDQLSDVLLVEPLFIQNIVQKMIQAGLVEQVDSMYKLTSKGLAQMATEIFIDQHEEKTEQLLYSPCHDKVFYQTLEEADDTLEDYRFYDYYSEWSLTQLDQQRVQKKLQAREKNTENENVQTVVETIDAINRLTVEVIPCLEFQLYNKEQDVFYARVWNTAFEEWDAQLEVQIHQYDRHTWREKFKETVDN